MSEVQRTEKLFRKVLKQVGCWPIKKVFPGFGASAHYAGTLPFSDNPDAFGLRSCGKLISTRNVYAADASGFKYLPAKGLLSRLWQMRTIPL